MTHKFETPDDFIELKKLFEKLETLADKMGVEVDDLIEENNQPEMRTTIRQNNFIKTIKRKRLVSHFDTGRTQFKVLKNTNV